MLGRVGKAEPVFLNVYWAPELIPKNEFRQPVAWARTFKCLCGTGIDSKEWIPPTYVAWRAGTITLFLLGS